MLSEISRAINAQQRPARLIGRKIRERTPPPGGRSPDQAPR